MRIFVISLISATDRRGKIQHQFDSANINFEFFDAIDNEALKNVYAPLINRDEIKNYHPRGLLDGEIGCALSHALLYKKIVDENIQHAIIFEDDVIINNEFSQMLGTTCLENSNLDIFLLCYGNAWCKRGSHKKFFKNFTAFKVWNAPIITAGYYLNQNAARHLNKLVFPISQVPDWPVGAHKGLKVACAYPQIVHHPLNNSGSTLEIARKALRLKYKNSKKENYLSRKLTKLKYYFIKPKNPNTSLPKFWLKLVSYQLP